MDVHTRLERADHHDISARHAAGIEHRDASCLACPRHSGTGNSGASDARTRELSRTKTRQWPEAAGSEERRRPFSWTALNDQRSTPVANARWMPRTSVPFFSVLEIGVLLPETQIFSSESRSNVPAVSTEKRVMAR
ncbi:hypothetical protein EDF70_1188 [Neorhizobium sp. JUb45]|nr:hypothetical protein EDF70_1188 [Neorhizobium sp. JUb45]